MPNIIDDLPDLAPLAGARFDDRTLLGLLLPNRGNSQSLDIRRIAYSLILLDSILADRPDEDAVAAIAEAAVARAVGSAPATLDTIAEIAEALQNNPDVIDQIIEQLGLRATKTELASAVSTINTALGGKASTGALSAVGDRVTALETSFPSRARVIARTIAYSGVR